jgi:hypothetical protein
MDVLKDLLERLPPPLQDYAQVLLLVAMAIVLLYAIILGFAKAAKAYREDIRPLFYDADERKRVSARQRLADFIEREIRNINGREEWSDYRFSELEAEVEVDADGRRRGFWLRRRSEGVRREKSLLRALRNSRARLILLEGEPGSGKSVAMRFLTSTLAKAAMKSRNAASLIPFYVNLKSIERTEGQAIDRGLIEAHVLKSLNRTNDRDVGEFLDKEFRRGMQDGTFLFLFDSFDELPDVLSVTSAETTIRQYGEAIADFLGGFNRCRGVVASRYFRGPGGLGWPRFLILALSDRYRRKLVDRFELPTAIERSLIGEIELRDSELSAMTRNPMFLSLLCDYMKKGRSFPDNIHAVFESYVSTRFKRDADKFQKHFHLSAEAVRDAAECAAFCMASRAGLGLSPSSDALIAAMQDDGYGSEARLMLEAIEYIKLARFEEQDRGRTFTFVHRRFQEYFATCVVLDQPDLVPPERLLSDARWRETAVVLLQTHKNVEPLLDAAAVMLTDIADFLDESYPAPLESELETPGVIRAPVQISWPPLALHLLGLLQSAFRGRADGLPEAVRGPASRIVRNVGWNGTLADRKWLIEVAGIAPQSLLTFLLRDAYASGSALLGDVAYRQVSVLRVVHEDIATPIRRALVSLFLTGRLNRQKHATRAHLMRIGDAKPFLRVLRLLLMIWPIDRALHAAVIVLILSSYPLQKVMPAVVVAALSLISLPALLTIGRQALGGVLFFAFFFRFTCAVVLIEMVSPDVLPGAMALGIVFAAATWAPIAVFAAQEGHFASIGWWPFFLFVPLLAPLWRVPRGLRAARQIKVEWGGVVFGGGFLACLLAAIKLQAYLSGVGKILAVCLGALALIGLGFGLVSYVRIYLRAHHWLKDDAPRSAGDMASLVEGLGYGPLQRLVIRTVRERSLLEANEDNEKTVRDFAWKVEASITHRDAATAVAPLLDELTMLADQLRAQRLT